MHGYKKISADNVHLFFYILQPVNQWLYQALGFFGNLTSGCLPLTSHVPYMWTSRDRLCGCIHTCLSAMHAASAFYPGYRATTAQAVANHQKAWQSIRAKHTDHSVTQAKRNLYVLLFSSTYMKWQKIEMFEEKIILFCFMFCYFINIVHLLEQCVKYNLSYCSIFHRRLTINSKTILSIARTSFNYRRIVWCKLLEVNVFTN